MDNIGDRIEDLSDSVEEKLANLRKALEEKPQAVADSIRNEYMDLQTKFMVKKDGHFGLARFASGYKKGLVLGNPSLGSKKFKGSVESIKNYITKKLKIQRTIKKLIFVDRQGNVIDINKLI